MFPWLFDILIDIYEWLQQKQRYSVQICASCGFLDGELHDL